MVRWARWHGLAAALLVAAAGLTAAPAAAQSKQDIDWCENKGDQYSFDLQVKGCTDIIQTGRGTPEMRAAAYIFRADAYAGQKDYDHAIADCTEAIKLDPKNAIGYYLRGTQYLHKKDYDRAIVDYNKSIELNDKDPATFFNRGNAYAFKGDYKRAIVDYDQSIKLDPNDAKVYYFRGLIKRLAGDAAGGDADIAYAKKLNPKIDD
jgi:tetratricopeptide (TPR) repeat protein